MFYKKYFEYFERFIRNENLRACHMNTQRLKNNGFSEIETVLINYSLFKETNKIIQKTPNEEHNEITMTAKKHFNLDKIIDIFNVTSEEDDQYCVIPTIKKIQYLKKCYNGDMSKVEEENLDLLNYHLIQYTAWDEKYLSSCGDNGELIREYMCVPINGTDSVIKLLFKITTETNNLQVIATYNPDIIEKLLYVDIRFMVGKTNIKGEKHGN